MSAVGYLYVSYIVIFFHRVDKSVGVHFLVHRFGIFMRVPRVAVIHLHIAKFCKLKHDPLYFYLYQLIVRIRKAAQGLICNYFFNIRLPYIISFGIGLRFAVNSSAVILMTLTTSAILSSNEKSLPV